MEEASERAKVYGVTEVKTKVKKPPREAGERSDPSLIRSRVFVRKVCIGSVRSGAVDHLRLN